MSTSDPRSPGHRSRRPSRRDRHQRAAQASGPVSDVHREDGVRLQKVLADAGLGSRRACETLITEGRVEVDGVVVRELGTRVDPETQAVHVDTMRITTSPEKVYLALNKPGKVVTAMSDPEGRRSIAEFVRDRPERLFHVGRLDYDTEGLLLLTNDGELSNRLTHPRYEIPKTYLAQVRGPVPRDSFRLVDSTPGHALVEVVLHSGRNRIVRRLLEAVGTPVERLVRTHFGPIALAEQRPGKLRALRPHELADLMKAVDL
jgi:16S rRNA U516 pseudouridylate synthase RsuA-like enzyme